MEFLSDHARPSKRPPDTALEPEAGAFSRTSCGMGGVGESIAAVMCCLVGGFMNSTWPLFCKPESPKMIRVATSGGWQWENVWLLFIVWSSILNMILCVWAVGPSALSAVYSQASKLDLSLVCIFSFLWGSGTMCFSLGIQLLGAGPGTALVMSLLVVIGTVLPLIADHSDDADSPAALVTIAGLLFAISGFVTSALSSRIKARAIAAAKKNQGVGGKQIEGGASSIGTVAADTSPSAGGVKAGRNNGTGSPLHENPSSSSVEKGLPSRPPLVLGDKQEAKSSHITAIAVCVAGAVMSSMLQFSFVYGEPLIDRAEDVEGVPGVAAPLVIWLLAFSLAAVWNVLYAIYLLYTNKTWGRYKWIGVGDLFWKFFNVTVMSLFFVGHIHLYGLAQYLFGDLGPVVAWPLIMSSTVLNGQLWSVFMKEWAGVPKTAMKINILSISLLVTAVTIIAIAGAVL